MPKQISSAYDYRSNTKQRIIALCIDRGLTRRETLAELLPSVNAQVEPLVFKFNSQGQRRPLPITKQRERLWHAIGRVMVEMGKVVDTAEAMPEDDSPEPEIPTVEDDSDTEPVVETPKPKKETQEQYFIRRLDEVRAWINQRAEISGTEKLDTLNNRPLLDGIRAIRAGISADAMLFAMSMHWPADVRAEAGIREIDFADECEPIESDDGECFHRLAGYALKLAKARIPIMFVGESGTGKSHLAKQLASLLADENDGESLPYAECPMTAGATPSWLLGNIQMPTPSNPDGFRPRKALQLFEDGGVFNFEEIDASDPNMLLVANQLLSAAEYFNPIDGETYLRHNLSVLVSTANTLGQGANRNYSGRERLDFATIDRFRMGRVPVHFDRELAVGIALAQ